MSEIKASLYHLITDEDSAKVRKAIVDNNLIDIVNFRNIDRSEDAKASLTKLLGGKLIVPTLVINDLPHVGLEACLLALDNLK